VGVAGQAVDLRRCRSPDPGDFQAVIVARCEIGERSTLEVRGGPGDDLG